MDLEMKPYWINRIGPTSNGKCLYNNISNTEKKEVHVKIAAEIVVMSIQAKEHQDPPKVVRGKKGIFPYSF